MAIEGAGQGGRDAEDCLKGRSEAILGPTQDLVSKRGRERQSGERELGREGSDLLVCSGLLRHACRCYSSMDQSIPSHNASL